MHFHYIAAISLGLAGTSFALPRKSNGTTYHSCRALPGDAAWPSVHAWKAFNATVNGRLIATTPLAQPCHGDFYDAETCENLKSQWDFPWIHSQDPSSIDQPWFQNGTCDPFHPVNQTCTLGNLVSYSVNLSSAADVQASLKFAEKKNLRVVIKNTGHDFIGKSTGKGGLGLWTHFLNSTEVIQNYTSPSYSGPAIKLGAGVQAYQAYEAAHEAGYRVTGGTCPTVGLAGGYTQGGGHGALSSLYGLGADNVLEWEVVTPKGEHIVTTPQNHSDLHWALSGGGGGTFGVVVSMTAKLHKDGPTSGGYLSFNTSSGVSAFWDVIEEFQGGLEPLVDSGAVALYQITNTNFLSIFTAPGLSESQLKQKLDFFTSSLPQHNITYTFTTSDDSTYFDHFVRYYGPLPAGIWETSHLVSSRLFPRSVIRENNSGVIAAYRNITSDPNWIAAGLAMNASHATAGNKPGDNAVLPAWRDALIHTLFYSPWDWEASQSTIQSREDHLTYNIAPSVEALTPGSGTYLNEANFNQLNWQETFYGENYDKLLAIKHKYDPHGLFYARTAVGSEAWAEDGSARLCRIG